MAGRPEIPNAGIVDLNKLVKSYFDNHGIPEQADKMSIDIVLTPWHSVSEKKAKNLIFLLDGKIYKTQRSAFVDALETTMHGIKFYIYDNFKNHSKSHKGSYRHQEVFEAPCGDQILYLPYYWRVN